MAKNLPVNNIIFDWLPYPMKSTTFNKIIIYLVHIVSVRYFYHSHNEKNNNNNKINTQNAIFRIQIFQTDFNMAKKSLIENRSIIYQILLLHQDHRT